MIKKLWVTLIALCCVLAAIGCAATRLAKPPSRALLEFRQQPTRLNGRFIIRGNSDALQGWLTVSPWSNDWRRLPVQEDYGLARADEGVYFWKVQGGMLDLMKPSIHGFSTSRLRIPSMMPVRDAGHFGGYWILATGRKWVFWNRSGAHTIKDVSFDLPLTLISSNEAVYPVNYGSASNVIAQNIASQDKRLVLKATKITKWAADSKPNLIYGLTPDNVVMRWRWNGRNYALNRSVRLPTTATDSFCEDMMPVPSTDWLIYSMRQRTTGLLGLDRTWIKHYLLNMSTGENGIAFQTPEDSATKIEGWLPGSLPTE